MGSELYRNAQIRQKTRCGKTAPGFKNTRNPNYAIAVPPLQAAEVAPIAAAETTNTPV